MNCTVRVNELEFHAGQVWLTRNGRVMRICEVSHTGRDYPIVAKDINFARVSFTKSGRYLHEREIEYGSTGEHGFDLVKLIEPKEENKKWNT